MHANKLYRARSIDTMTFGHPLFISNIIFINTS